jgi:hypothetical protein
MANEAAWPSRMLKQSKLPATGKACGLIGLCTALMLSSAVPSHAEKLQQLPPLEGGNISARYSVHWGVLRLADITLTWRLTETDFETRMTARTRGLIRAVFKADSLLTSSGLRQNSALQTSSFTTDSVFNGDAFVREMTFAASGQGTIIRRVTPDDFELVREPVPTALQIGPDPLTAFLETMLQPGSVLQSRSYDGVQVLENTLECDEALDTLKKKRRSLYHGEAQRCSLTGDVLAGDIIEEDAPEQDREDEDVDGRDFQTFIWFARTADDILRLPVRVRAQSKRGTLKIHLREVGGELKS